MCIRYTPVPQQKWEIMWFVICIAGSKPTDMQAEQWLVIPTSFGCCCFWSFLKWFLLMFAELYIIYFFFIFVKPKHSSPSDVILRLVIFSLLILRLSPMCLDSLVRFCWYINWYLQIRYTYYDRWCREQTSSDSWWCRRVSTSCQVLQLHTSHNASWPAMPRWHQRIS